MVGSVEKQVLSHSSLACLILLTAFDQIYKFEDFTLKLLRYLLLLALPVCLLTACTGSSTQEAAKKETTTTQTTTTSATPIQIGFSAWPGWIPWQIAQEKGIFEKNAVPAKMV